MFVILLLLLQKLFQSLQYATSSISTSFSGCLPFFVKLVLCYGEINMMMMMMLVVVKWQIMCALCWCH